MEQIVLLVLVVVMYVHHLLCAQHVPSLMDSSTMLVIIHVLLLTLIMEPIVHYALQVVPLARLAFLQLVSHALQDLDFSLVHASIHVQHLITSVEVTVHNVQLSVSTALLPQSAKTVPTPTVGSTTSVTILVLLSTSWTVTIVLPVQLAV